MSKKSWHTKLRCEDMRWVQLGDEGDHTLTPSQAKKLCPKDKLGCGTFACAYTSGKNKKDVVKLTSDPSDVAAFTTLKDKRIASLRGAYRLKGYKNRFALVTERLRPLRGSDKEYGYMYDLDTALRWFDADRRHVSKGAKKVPKNVRKNMEYACNKNKGCKKFVNELMDLHERAAKKGINLFDFHAGNFGKTAKGKWKMLDLGVSGKRPGKIKTLKGL